MKSKKTVLILLVIVIATIAAYFFSQTTKNNDPYLVTVFKIDNGYGYHISFNNKLLIKQEQIPAIQNITPFCNKKDALIIGELVKNKIINKENPKITTSELTANNITLNCNN